MSALELKQQVDRLIGQVRYGETDLERSLALSNLKLIVDGLVEAELEREELARIEAIEDQARTEEGYSDSASEGTDGWAAGRGG